MALALAKNQPGELWICKEAQKRNDNPHSENKFSPNPPRKGAQHHHGRPDWRSRSKLNNVRKIFNKKQAAATLTNGRRRTVMMKELPKDEPEWKDSKNQAVTLIMKRFLEHIAKSREQDSGKKRPRRPSISAQVNDLIRDTNAHQQQLEEGPLIKKPEPTSDKVFSTKTISQHHGFLVDQNLRGHVATTNYTERELFSLFARFKALCALSSTPIGIDKETFRKGVPMLSVEDDYFVSRVFEVLDEDGSGIIDWHEFLEAMSSLEKGTRKKRTEFLFRVYDIDGDGGITRDELAKFFLSSLMVEVEDNIKELADYFVQQVFAEIDRNSDGSMTVSEALRFIETHPEVTDIYGMFGRSMTSDNMESFGRGDFLQQKKQVMSGKQHQILPQIPKNRERSKTSTQGRKRRSSVFG